MLTSMTGPIAQWPPLRMKIRVAHIWVFGLVLLRITNVRPGFSIEFVFLPIDVKVMTEPGLAGIRWFQYVLDAGSSWP